MCYVNRVRSMQFLIGTGPQILHCSRGKIGLPSPSLTCRQGYSPHPRSYRRRDEHTLTVASPVTYITPAAPLFSLIHGTADTVVPYAQSEVLTQAPRNAGVSAQLVPIAGAEYVFNGHDDVDGVVRLSVDYLLEALRTSLQ